MSWGGSPAVGAPPMWLPSPPTRFWPPLGSGFWRPPPQSYPGQPFKNNPPQTGQGYWPSPTPWGAPPGGQATPPFGLPPWRTPLRPTTFTPPTIRQAYVKIGSVCLFDYFAFLTHSFTCLSGRLKVTIRQRARIRLHQCPLKPNGGIRRQRRRQQRGVIVLVLFVFGIVLSCRTIV
jgi:hypothetical protein